MVARPALQFSNVRASGAQSWLARHARSALGGLIVAGVAILAAGAAAVLAVAALAFMAILAVLGVLLYAFARLRLRRAPVRAAASNHPGGPGGPTLDARRAGGGWRVDALGRFGG